jgi:selenide,water dikinase
VQKTHTGAKDYAKNWLFPAGSCRNQKCYEDQVEFAAGITEDKQMLMFTPETSGGLLAAVPESKLDTLKRRFDESNEPYWIVGNVKQGQGVEVLNGHLNNV